jgi:hypothetical protein
VIHLVRLRKLEKQLFRRLLEVGPIEHDHAIRASARLQPRVAQALCHLPDYVERKLLYSRKELGYRDGRQDKFFDTAVEFLRGRGWEERSLTSIAA